MLLHFLRGSSHYVTKLRSIIIFINTINIHIHVHVRVHVRVRVRVRVCVHVRVHVRVCVRIHVHVRVHVNHAISRLLFVTSKSEKAHS